MEELSLFDVSTMTLKEIERTLAAPPVSEAFLSACRSDPRKAAQRLVKRYERAQAERSRVAALYAYEDAAAAETESFLSRVYGGSLGLMMSAMVESRQLTEADIAELSAILERAGGEEHA